MLELTVYMIMAVLALSLALIWGYGGILCFGQSAFFGLGAYTYAIAMFNIGESTVPFLLAIALPAAFAALLGYFMFYGRISDVYLGVITLTVTLILFNSINSTAGPEFHIGAARLGGFNGIPGDPAAQLAPATRPRSVDLEGMFYLSTAALLSDLFRTAAAAGQPVRPHHRRHSRERAARRAARLRPARLQARDLHHRRRRSPASPAACSPIGAISSARPSSGWRSPPQIIIWVIVGGRGTLIGPIIGCIGIQWLTTALGANQPSGSDWWTKLLANAPLIFGVILIAFVLLVPKGLVPTLGDFGRWLLRARTRRVAASLEPKQAEEG